MDQREDAFGSVRIEARDLENALDLRRAQHIVLACGQQRLAAAKRPVMAEARELIALDRIKRRASGDLADGTGVTGKLLAGHANVLSGGRRHATRARA